MKTYSTKQTAQLAGVHFITLQRWVKEGRVSPSMRIKQNSREIWVWTAGDMRRTKRQGPLTTGKAVEAVTRGRRGRASESGYLRKGFNRSRQRQSEAAGY